MRVSVINSLRSSVGWISRRNTTARELIKSAKAQRLSLLSKRRNAEFVKLHPGEPMPPLDLMADAHAHCDYAAYYDRGLFQAQFYLDLFARHFDFAQPARVQIFEWGCGTGRILRHLRRLYDPAAVVLRGSDYNPAAVEWCASAFPDIPVFRNDVAPPLELAENSIDIAYCSSVFTHLSDDLCRRWIAELSRVVRPGGLISFTIAGMSFAYRYQESEKDAYRRGIPIYREWDEVGRRDFFSWHPAQYVRRVFLSGLEELEYVSSEDSGLNQDLWLARVP
jgi:SAM-dependent methyltransferase